MEYNSGSEMMAHGSGIAYDVDALTVISENDLQTNHIGMEHIITSDRIKSSHKSIIDSILF